MFFHNLILRLDSLAKISSSTTWTSTIRGLFLWIWHVLQILQDSIFNWDCFAFSCSSLSWLFETHCPGMYLHLNIGTHHKICNWYSNWDSEHTPWRFTQEFMVGTSLVAQTVKRLPARRKTWVQSLGQEDPLEKEMATHCNTLAWKIPWTEEPGRLQSMGLQRVRHDWATSLSLPWWYHPSWDKDAKTDYFLSNETVHPSQIYTPPLLPLRVKERMEKRLREWGETERRQLLPV